MKQSLTFKDITPPQNFDTKSFERFLDLPRELRDHIYREWLLPDKTLIEGLANGSVTNGSSPYRLQPLILIASKDVHAEAAKVLYEETNWILLTTNYAEDHGLLQFFQKIRKPWVSVKHLERFPGTPVLRINVVDGISRSRRIKDRMLVTQQDVHHFCLHISQIPSFEIHLIFDADAMQNASVRDVLVDCCRDIRGAKRVTIIRPDCPFPYEELTTQLQKPIRHAREICTRADQYHRRADLQLAQMQLLSAADTFWTGFFFMFTLIRYTHLNIRSKRMVRIKAKQITFSIGCADCLVKARLPEQAQRILQIAFYSVNFPDGPTFQQFSSFPFALGLALEAAGDDAEAARKFQLTLALQPGHEGADYHLDLMEARLGMMEHRKRRMLKAYLNHIVISYRHRLPGSQSFQKDIEAYVEGSKEDKGRSWL